jgi:hypothetical protein
LAPERRTALLGREFTASTVDMAAKLVDLRSDMWDDRTALTSEWSSLSRMGMITHFPVWTQPAKFQLFMEQCMVKASPGQLSLADFVAEDVSYKYWLVTSSLQFRMECSRALDNVALVYEVVMGSTGLGDSMSFKILRRRLDEDGLGGLPDAFVFYSIHAGLSKIMTAFKEQPPKDDECLIGPGAFARVCETNFSLALAIVTALDNKERGREFGDVRYATVTWPKPNGGKGDLGKQMPEDTVVKHDSPKRKRGPRSGSRGTAKAATPNPTPLSPATAVVQTAAQATAQAARALRAAVTTTAPCIFHLLGLLGVDDNKTPGTKAACRHAPGTCRSGTHPASLKAVTKAEALAVVDSINSPGLMAAWRRRWPPRSTPTTPRETGAARPRVTTSAAAATAARRVWGRDQPVDKAHRTGLWGWVSSGRG